MTKIGTLLKTAIMTFLVFCNSLFAQERPKIAVYVSEHRGYSQDAKSALRTATLNTIVRSGIFEVVERSNVVDEELRKQASGAVDDDQLTAFGRQAGAQYICVSDMIFLGSAFTQSGTSYKYYQVSARIIDVETAEIISMSIKTTNITSGQEMSNAVTDVIMRTLRNVSLVKNINVPKVAVYLQGNNSESEAGRALYTYILGGLFARSRTNGNFKVVERSEAFTRQIDKELGKQRSGSVDDSQIMRMGKQYGVQSILIANIEYAMNAYNISGRIVDVETASVISASQMYQSPRDLANMVLINPLNPFNSGLRFQLAYNSTRMVEDMIKLKVMIPEGTKKLKAERMRDEQINGLP